jgi:hypothetical protein
MVVKLYFENIVSPDAKTDRMYKLMKIDGCLPRGWLPRIYLHAPDYFYLTGPTDSPILTVCSSHRSPVGAFKHGFKIGENVSPEFKEWISSAVNRGGTNLHNVRNMKNLNIPSEREREAEKIIRNSANPLRGSAGKMDESRPLRDALAPAGVGQMLVAPPSLIKKYVAYAKREERPVNFTDFAKKEKTENPAPPMFLTISDAGGLSDKHVVFNKEMFEISNLMYSTLSGKEAGGRSVGVPGYEGSLMFPPVRIRPGNVPPWDPAEAGWNPIDIDILLNVASAVNSIDDGENIVMINLSKNRGENMTAQKSEKKSPKVRVVFKNVLSQGQKIFKIISIDGVKNHEELPVKYLQGDTLFYMYNTGCKPSLKLKSGDEDRSPAFAREVSIRVGEFVSPDMKGWIIRTLRGGSAELKKINIEVDRLKAEWEGKEDVITV